MLKPSENPPILSPDVNSVSELEGPWLVAHTKARFEKVFAWDMLDQGIGYFLPLREKVIFSGGRKRRLMMPLFAGYVFFCGTEEQRYRALATNRLCQTIDVVDQQGLIYQLESIHKALLSNAVIDSYPELPVGKRARVKNGPMMGLEGIIIEKCNSQARMVLEVSILGQGALVEIDADILEPLESMSNSSIL